MFKSSLTSILKRKINLSCEVFHLNAINLKEFILYLHKILIGISK
uniref:Uncharacterized protein n=1 Tax=Myoviridae sp. ctx322 TaxID=2826711 RepID=A0A8S5NAU2_9CAUD|nr:MAG TPA: hypothetical protein [Myoviridae sp. ctx322]